MFAYYELQIFKMTKLFGADVPFCQVTDKEFNIIEKIRNAKSLIWIAVSWFTDPVLYKELLKKKSLCVNVQIVIDDNDRNRKAPFRLEDDSILAKYLLSHYIKT